MNATATLQNEMIDTWNPIFATYENVRLMSVGEKEQKSRMDYWFSFFVTSKRGKQMHCRIAFSKPFKQNKLTFVFSDTKSKEMSFLLSELTEVIIEHIELLDPSLTMITTFGQIEFPYSYRNKEKREEVKVKRTGVKKADILAKKDTILSFFNELKTKDLPEIKPGYDERRVFQIGGGGAKYLIELLIELGIASDPGKWGSYYTIRFNPDHYEATYYSVMDEWEEFIKKIIGLEKCFVHCWYMD